MKRLSNARHYTKLIACACLVGCVVLVSASFDLHCSIATALHVFSPHFMLCYIEQSFLLYICPYVKPTYILLLFFHRAHELALSSGCIQSFCNNAEN